MNAALALSLVIFFMIGVPIAVAIGLASVIGIEVHGSLPLLLVAQRMVRALRVGCEHLANLARGDPRKVTREAVDLGNR